MNLNSPMFHEAKCIADFGGRFAFGVSLGRDFAVVLHVMSQLTDMKRHAFFHWTKYPRLLPYQARYLALLEKMYGFKAEIQIWPECKKAKQQDVIREFMERNGCSLYIQGFRMDESLQRRGMLKKLTDGIDYVRHYGYPLRSWTSKTVRGYCTANRCRSPSSIRSATSTTSRTIGAPRPTSSGIPFRRKTTSAQSRRIPTWRLTMSGTRTTRNSSTASSAKTAAFLQVGKVVRIKRSQVVEDDLNPRFISDENAKRLRKSIKKNGLVGHLVWNRHTGHIVGGHQRLAAIDSLTRKDDYELDVLEVNLPLKDEVRMNVVLNNTDNQGYFDFGQLQRLSEEFGLSVDEDFGFSEEVASIEFPDLQKELEKGSDVPPPVYEASADDIAVMKEKKKETRERQKEAREELGDWRTEAKGVLTIVFEKESEKKKWLSEHGMDENANVVHIWEIEDAIAGKKPDEGDAPEVHESSM